MEVNFLGAVKMSQVFLSLLRRSRGRIVNMTSMAGPWIRNTDAFVWCYKLKRSLSPPPRRRGSDSAVLRLRSLQGGIGRLLKGDEAGVIGLGSPSVLDPTFRLQNEYV